MLKSFGWSDALQNAFTAYAAQGLVPARVTIQHRGHYRLVAETGEFEGRVSGRFAHDAAESAYPVTGDWVAIEPAGAAAVIHHVLPRSTVFTRKAAGPSGAAQVVAANVDVALLSASLNGDLSLRRLERYLAMAFESGAAPVIVLTKSDLAPDSAALAQSVRAMAPGVPVLAVSANTGNGLDELRAYLEPGKTAVLLGSSGVGKSTLVNALAGETRMATKAIREDDARGRHTTTHRELILLPSGALILDTPGMRELALWEMQEGLALTFADLRADIDALAEDCRFRDCSHGNEPGCAVRAALEAGQLDAERYASWRKLQKEIAHEVRKEDPRLRAQARRVWVSRTKSARALEKQRRRERDD